MVEENKSVSKEDPNKTFSFTKKNYLWMVVGLVCIALGFLLMMGNDANTRPDGVFDPHYWNNDIFSWRRIRLAPTLVIIGFVIEVYAIMLKPNSNKI